MYNSLAKLSAQPAFYVQLKKANGVTVLCAELNKRKKAMKANRRNRALLAYDENNTMMLLQVLRRDWACTRIQNFARDYFEKIGFKRKKKY